MYGGTRYSLILFFGRICPWAPEHALVRCDADCLRRLYADYGGNYNCNGCNRSCVDLGWPSMLHCAAGCEFDVCDACATRYVPKRSKRHLSVVVVGGGGGGGAQPRTARFCGWLGAWGELTLRIEVSAIPASGYRLRHAHSGRTVTPPQVLPSRN